MKTAILLGASGLIGSILLRELIADPRYGQILVLVRREISAGSAKVRQIIVDQNTIERERSKVIGDDLFIAIGTTRAKTPNQAEYLAIDRDYPIHAAKIAKSNGARYVSIVTAVGANPDSKLFYPRTKGEIERELIALGFDRTAIFQPSMLLGQREERRPFEKTLMNLWSAVNPIFQGRASRYRGITGEAVAKAMIRAAQTQQGRVAHYQWAEMQETRIDYPG